MPRFRLTVSTPLPVDEAWRALWDLRAHGRVIPGTTLCGQALASPDPASALGVGSEFVARTGWGRPFAVDDRMRVTRWEPPAPAGPAIARAEIAKLGRVVTGRIAVAVAPASITPESTTPDATTPLAQGSRIDWIQEIGVRPLPPAFDPIVARVARAAYGRTIRALLALRGG